MNKYFKTVLFLLMGFYSNAQELTIEQVDSLTNIRIQELVKTNEPILQYESGCIGCYFISEDGCNCLETNYLIYLNAKVCQIQKIDCCGVSEPTKFENSIWDNFTSNSIKILNSNFKVEYFVTHHYYDFLTLHSADTSISVKIRDYYFESDVADSLTNTQQPAKTFIDQLIKATSKWEKKN